VIVGLVKATNHLAFDGIRYCHHLIQKHWPYKIPNIIK